MSVNLLTKERAADFASQRRRDKAGTKERGQERFTAWFKWFLESKGIAVPEKATVEFVQTSSGTLKDGAIAWLSEVKIVKRVVSESFVYHNRKKRRVVEHEEFKVLEEIPGTRVSVPLYCLPCRDATAFWAEHAPAGEWTLA